MQDGNPGVLTRFNRFVPDVVHSKVPFSNPAARTQSEPAGVGAGRAIDRDQRCLKMRKMKKTQLEEPQTGDLFHTDPAHTRAPRHVRAAARGSLALILRGGTGHKPRLQLGCGHPKCQGGRGEASP